MSKSQISNQIRNLRFHYHEMTQQQLADKVGVTRQTIIAMEKGKYSPSLELGFRISRVFGSPLEEVYFYEDEDEKKERGHNESNRMHQIWITGCFSSL